MRRPALILFCFALLFAVGSCRPLKTPMPVRLDDEEQRAVNESWEKVLVPVDRFDNQALLDILLVSNAYQMGVDKLEFRSEKKFSGGTIIMEIRYDRLLPDKDRFEVKILNSEGKIVRQESYDRKQIDKTDQDLIVDCHNLRQKREQNEATPDEIKRLDAFEARFAVIEKVFPKVEEKQKKDNNKKANAK